MKLKFLSWKSKDFLSSPKSFAKLIKKFQLLRLIKKKQDKKIHEETPDQNICEEVSDSSNIPDKIKFKCDQCGSNIKKEITLKKHKNTKHDPNNCPSSKKIGEGNFGFAFDARPGQEAAAEALRLEYSKEKKDENNLSEKEINIVVDKVERQEYEHSVNDEKGKERELLDVEDYFQIEVVDGETLFVCNVCNEGLDTEQEIAKHIQNNHESLLNDDSYDDNELYEGFE